MKRERECFSSAKNKFGSLLSAHIEVAQIQGTPVFSLLEESPGRATRSKLQSGNSAGS